ncbi:hypothetical protein Patl1_16640 [Pistacia atlantica]|uniref:Uncharacterized protein n=1 Tax=Pistacia atlantica TaxID=434234 RepID=A0ACC1B7U5_9ROSI|nr:hypothetical protein Patl1_16640 [Pistacia atlantica]
MKGEGVMGDHSQRRTWPGKRTLNGCQLKRNLDNVVYIDVDSESLDNVIIIDVPESLQQKIRGSRLGKGKKIQFGGIINIDDDESNGVEYPGVGVEGGADLDSDTSSSQSFPAPAFVHKSVNLGDDECQVVHEKNSAFRFSKCKQSYSGKYHCRNRYGLSPESESGSSDSDCSDCELMEGSFGKLHKEWEKASLKRKSNFCRGKSGLEDQASPSCVNDDIHLNMDAEGEKRAEQHSESAFCCKSSTNNYKKRNSAFVPTDDGELGSSSLNSGMRCSFVESDQKCGQESFPWFKPGLMERVHSARKKADFQCRGEKLTKDPSSSSSRCQSYKHADSCGSRFHDKEQNSHGPFWSNQEQGDKQCHKTGTCFMGRQKKFMGERFMPQGVNWFFNHRKTNLEDEEAYLFKGQRSGTTHAHNERVVPSEKYEEFSQTSSCCASHQKAHNAGTGFMEKEKPVSKEPLVSSCRPSYEAGAECGVAPADHNVGDAFDESFLCKTSSTRMPEVCKEKVGQADTEKPDSKRISVCNTECAETQSEQGNQCSEELKEQVIGSTADSQLGNGRDPVYAQSDVVIPNLQNDIISDREKLKETDEYKRAMEEEWAARQRQLQIQGEEAQRLRKKRRAESIRLLDMERRQKQRLEEIRETQKKDEENMNMKEQLRVEVRKELHKLETTCIDMASLLRALGINVGSSFHPLSHEASEILIHVIIWFVS